MIDGIEFLGQAVKLGKGVNHATCSAPTTIVLKRCFLSTEKAFLSNYWIVINCVALYQTLVGKVIQLLLS